MALFHRNTAVERERVDTIERERPVTVRGGVAPVAILTGMVVAFGAMFLLSAIVGGILAATGVDAADVGDTTREGGLAAGVALVVAMFVAYLWGGYTAGRMGRGAGLLNGLMVPILALIVAAIVAAVVTAMGADPNLNLPFSENQLPIQGDNLVDFGQAIGIASLIAMFLGGVLGGMAGSRWHTKLERRYVQDHAVEVRRHEVDLDRDPDVAPGKTVATSRGTPVAPGPSGSTRPPEERTVRETPAEERTTR